MNFPEFKLKKVLVNEENDFYIVTSHGPVANTKIAVEFPTLELRNDKDNAGNVYSLNLIFFLNLTTILQR